jgi:DNA-binding response OmpR family regulator
MAKVRILVAEDERADRERFAQHARGEGFYVEEAADGPGALRAARHGADVVLVASALPGFGGLDVMRVLRREGNTVPVILLSAECDEVERVVGFEIGADDVVPRPTSPRELLARIRSVLRRAGIAHDARPHLLRFGRLEVDEAAREVRVDGCDVGLKPREFALILTLALSPGVAFSRSTLLERVWGFDFDGDERTVDVHVRRLRHKVEERPRLPAHLRTVHGYGYKFAPAH